MLKLKNIKMTDEFIEADYTPESSNLAGHVKLDLKTGEDISIHVSDYGETYSMMALTGLEQIIEESKKNKHYKMPKEQVVMWY